LSISHDTEMLLTNDARRRSVILQTTALRASLLCRPQAYPSNSSL
jgi:hypothetical protein